MLKQWRAWIRQLGAIALCVSTAACASSRSAPKPFPTPVAGVREVPDSNPDTAAMSRLGAGRLTDMVVRTALDLRGVPYRNGGSDLSGFDCSGFTQYVYARAGRPLPRETREQFMLGSAVARGEQQPGDLIFFTTTAPGASHVGIALGGDAFVHAPSTRGVVRVESLGVPYWSRRLVGIRRIAGG